MTSQRKWVYFLDSLIVRCFDETNVPKQQSETQKFRQLPFSHFDHFALQTMWERRTQPTSTCCRDSDEIRHFWMSEAISSVLLQAKPTLEFMFVSFIYLNHISFRFGHRWEMTFASIIFSGAFVFPMSPVTHTFERNKRWSLSWIATNKVVPTSYLRTHNGLPSLCVCLYSVFWWTGYERCSHVVLGQCTGTHMLYKKEPLWYLESISAEKGQWPMCLE